MRIQSTFYNINNINNNYVQKKQYNIQFAAASDITIKYVYENHKKHLPPRVAEKINEYLISGRKDLPTLLEVHREVYQRLQDAASLDEVKENYEEFRNVLDVRDLEVQKSQVLSLLKEKNNFTLDYLKKLYIPELLADLVSEYGFNNTGVLRWLNKKLNIDKLGKTYIKLLKMSDEKENARVADLCRKAFYSVSPEVFANRKKKAAEGHKDPDSRRRMSEKMTALYANRPDISEMSSKVAKMTWDLCPEIKAAMKEYTKNAPALEKKVLTKRNTGQKLNSYEKKVLSDYYRGFWDNNPDFKSLYQKCRIQVLEELKKAEK